MNSLQRLFEDAEYFCLKLRIYMKTKTIHSNRRLLTIHRGLGIILQH